MSGLRRVPLLSGTPLLRDHGRIVAMSYWPGSHLGGFLPYFAMGTNKAGIEAMCRYFAVALAPRRITVNAICPGITDDSIVNKLPSQAQEAMLTWLRATAGRRWGALVRRWTSAVPSLRCVPTMPAGSPARQSLPTAAPRS
jgi:NAD(P)-dependent dehydrogenase (short-subunit alcohol dehydrogenase family)